MKKWLPLTLIILSGSAIAQDQAIDTTLTQCLNGASTTMAMNQCYGEANKAWDKEMNSQYSALMKKLTGQPKESLRNAQRAWISYRDSWLAASRSQFASQGTLGSVSLGAQGVSLVRNQALMLQSLNKGSCANPDDC